MIVSSDFDGLAGELGDLIDHLGPLARQWDRLSDQECYMFVLTGPTKVDLIFEDRPHVHVPAWVVGRDTLSGIDDHFWDWALWLTSKVHAQKHELVADELVKMHEHLLCPMGEGAPSSLRNAVSRYLGARQRWSDLLHVKVDDRLGNAVCRVVDEVYDFG